MLQRLRGWIDPYIVLMFATVGLAAILPARGAGATVAGGAADAAIVFLFFLYGARLSPGAAWAGLKQWRLHLAVVACTFVLFPLLGVGLGRLAAFGLPEALVTGVVFLSLLPSTVQSSIAFTSIARGNVAAALCAASASNLLGVVLTPVLAGWLLHAQGVHLSFEVFRDILLQLLAPFFLGQALRRWIGAWTEKNRQVLGLVDRGSILLIIYVAFSRGMVDGVWSQVAVADLGILAVLLAGLLAAVLGLTWLLGRGLGFDRPDWIVLQFCGSKKSLASGLPMATVLFAGPQLGLVVLPLMLFHQLQLVICAILARRYAAAAAAAAAVQTEIAVA